MQQADYAPGAIAVWAGHTTAEALTAWQSELAGLSAAVDRAPVLGVVASHLQTAWPQQRDLAAFYGAAGSFEASAGVGTLPFPFVLAWNPAQNIATFRCHRRLTAPMTAIFAESAKHYGKDEMISLRLHLFGGCFNHRPMRGGSARSTHAWGAGIDIDPDRNQFCWGRDGAALAQPEYDAFWGIVAGQCATSLGHAANRDWMHVHFARL